MKQFMKTIAAGLMIAFCATAAAQPKHIKPSFFSPNSKSMYSLKGHIYSIAEDEGLDSAFRGASGEVWSNGTFKLVYSSKDVLFTAKVTMSTRDGRLRVNMEIVPGAGTTFIEAKTYDLDMTNLRAQYIELGRNHNRVYGINLLPSIEMGEEKNLEPVAAATVSLEEMEFENSIVLLDSSRYAGTILGLSGVKNVYVDIPGVARVDFSLASMDDANASGTLEKGQIRIQNTEGKTLTINNVLSPLAGGPLEGGPYKVWARWSPPTDTEEAAKTKIQKMMAEVGSSVDPELLKKLGNAPTITYGGSGGNAPPEFGLLPDGTTPAGGLLHRHLNGTAPTSGPVVIRRSETKQF